MPRRVLSAALPEKISAPSPPIAFSIVVSLSIIIDRSPTELTALGVKSTSTALVIAAKFKVSFPATSSIVLRAASVPSVFQSSVKI